MASIIKQKPQTPGLPDFRNLGTVLRILLIVNGMTLAAAFATEPRAEFWWIAWFDNVAYVEPYLLTVLMILYALQPVFERLSYNVGIAVIALVTAAVGGVYDLVLFPVPGSKVATLFRHGVLSLAGVAVLLFYFQLRARALSPAITEARLQALQARIRPHFLFNSINAVLSLVRTEPKRAEVALEDMADLFRVIMRDNRDLAPLADEVELCRQYLDLEKLRLGERLEVEWHLKSMPGDALVPPLVLQPLLENAVYHGIEPSSTPGVVSINIFFKSGDVHAIVRNPYRVEGGRHHAGNKMALGNVRERLALHFDAEASLTSRVREDAYEVHIRIPYRSAATRSRGAATVPQGADRGRPAGDGAGTPVQRQRARATGRSPLNPTNPPETSRA